MSSTIEFDRLLAEHILGQDYFTEEKAQALKGLLEASRRGDLAIAQTKLASLDSLPSSIVADGNELFPNAPIIKSKGYYYLQRNWVYETYLVQQVERLRKKTVPDWLDMATLQKHLPSLPLLPSQACAIQLAASNCLSILSGGPGSGKTYTASYLVQLLFSSLKKEKKNALRVVVAAPTGKAAFHLHAVIQKLGMQSEATTLHHLLRLRPNEERLFSPRFLDADVVIVDEASMIDVSLMAHLLESIGDETLLILIGDPDQLPPVEGGSLFSEMANLFGAHLDQCVRVETKELQQIAWAVKEGDFSSFTTYLQTKEPQITYLQNKTDLYHWIDPLLSENLPDPQSAIERYAKRRVLCPIREGKEGVDALNAELWEQIALKKLAWAIPILATVNDSWSGIYNGMNGVLIGKSRNDATAWFVDSTNTLRPISPPPPYEIALCLSVHKSQGCEFDEVLALFPPGSEAFGKEGLYTAITRAKKRLWLQGSLEVFAKMVQTSSQMASCFTSRIRNFE